MKHGGGALKVLDCISVNGFGDLVRNNGFHNAEKEEGRYRKIIIRHAIPSKRHMIDN